MSESSSTSEVRRIERKNPKRYNVNAHVQEDISASDILAGQNLRFPEVKLSSGTPYSAELLKAMLPVMQREKSPQSLEFINMNDWHKREVDHHRLLKGAILRGAGDEVLLLVFGVGIDDYLSNECYAAFREAFAITDDETQTLKDMTWASLEYSVILHLS